MSSYPFIGTGGERTLRKFIEPERPGMVATVAQKGDVKIELYWPETNDDPRFKVNTVRSDYFMTLAELRWVACAIAEIEGVFRRG